MIKKLAAAAVSLALQSPVFAEGHAVGLKAGALGLGLEYTFNLNDRVAFRAGLNGSQLGFDDEESGIDYDFDFVWDSLSVGVDFHPFQSAFRLSAGFLKNDNRLEAESRPTAPITVGDTTYTPQQVGTLIGRASFDDGTMLGLGWDWSHDKRFGISLDMGLLDQGDPEVTLRGTGTLLGNPAFQDDIRSETAELDDSLSDLDTVPFMSLGFVFRF